MKFVVYESAPNERKPDLVVVDIGFSETRRSCGFQGPENGAAAERLAFGEMLERVAASLEQHPKAILVIEAPLSGRYDAKGNPSPRQPFEREPKPAKPSSRKRSTAGANQGSKKKAKARKTRGWYHGAGAAVALGAQRLLAYLAKDPRFKKRTVVLAEAFLTRVGGALKDDQAAALIHREFRPGDGREVEGAVALVPGLKKAPRVWAFSSAKKGPR